MFEDPGAKLGQGCSKVMMYIKVVELVFLILHTQFEEHDFSPGKETLLRFIHDHDEHLNMIWSLILNCVLPSRESFSLNFS